MPKFLAVDIGNTNIKRAVSSSGELADLRTDPALALDQIALEIAATDLPVALCAVKPGAANAIKSALAKQGKKLLLEINDTSTKPVSGYYQGMGADRIADAAAAFRLFGGNRPVAALGLGTGTTLTAISSDGRFMGGFTTLGLGPICKHLTEALPALPGISPVEGRTFAPGLNVYDALCRGTVSAHTGAIEKWIAIMRAELGNDLFVVATGGWCELIAQLTESIDVADPLLTLKGIGILAAGAF